MHGHGQGYGYAPPPPPPLPSRGARVALRVLFVAIAVLSLGILGFVPMLRLALTTRRKLDRWAFTAAAVTQAVCWAGIFSDPGGDDFITWWGNAAMGLMIVNMFASVTYYLVADARHTRRHTPVAPPTAMATGAPAPYPDQPSYGYPRPHPYPQAPTTPPAPAMPVMPTQPTATPPPHADQPRIDQPRIDQVRAELDELSDYLRKQEDGR
ncbi:hypothetical protein [Streptomyces beihaiensis]|uniref:Integral membrane protein n=1 Tax=Streptomyces beihaiensis TaxID=2984495 RepID=A0ABT3U2E4_9ACTN|nr:hypothetical protein [Streptomyces beihaiensis]MCX3063449.1 hypothetical protein [Streptomyces beihaiensis]